MPTEECIHLFTPEQCYICNGHQARDKRDAKRRRAQFLAMLFAGKITPNADNTSRNQRGNPVATSNGGADVRTFIPHGGLFIDDNDRFRKGVR